MLVLAPVVWVETSCRSAPESTQPATLTDSLVTAEHRRDLVNTWLTYPEWSIVHAYEDFSAVQQQRGEPGFNYAGSIAGYWRNLCRVYGVAHSRGPVSPDMRVMLHVIGISYSVEMAIKGLYETTIGFLTLAWQGDSVSAEDQFSRAVSQDYAKFLRQTPWYEYPFASTLLRFWRETPFDGHHWLRAGERRVALTLEWGIKTVWAKVLGAAAGLAPAPLTLRSVLRDLTQKEIAVDPRVTVIDQTADGRLIIETPRYSVYSEIVRALAVTKGQMIEIAGNTEVFVTVLSPADERADPALTQRVTTSRLAGREGWERRGYTVPVPQLLALVRQMHDLGMEFEHVYDY